MSVKEPTDIRPLERYDRRQHLRLEKRPNAENNCAPATSAKDSTKCSFFKNAARYCFYLTSGYGQQYNRAMEGINMNHTVNQAEEFHAACSKMLYRFTDLFPNEAFRVSVLESLQRLEASFDDFNGQPGGWAGAIIYLTAKHGGRKITPPVFLNSDLEATFVVSMSTIRKRAEQLWEVVFPEAYPMPIG